MRAFIKKLVLCVLSMLSVISVYAYAQPEIITIGQTKLVSVSAGETKIYSFSPTHDGTYTFYSVSDKDTFGYLYDNSMAIIARDDDSGDASNFSITCDLKAQNTYFFGARSYENDPCEFEVRLEAYSPEVKAFGVCGEKVLWSLGTDGSLRIYGEGAMYNYVAGNTPWRNEKSFVKSLDIESGITVIGAFSFYDCNLLGNIFFAESVMNIGEYAFYNCSAIKSINLTQNVAKIGKDAFFGCTSLLSVSVPDSVTSIGEHAFGYTDNDKHEAVKVSGFTLTGGSGTAAHRYSQHNSIEFVSTSVCEHINLRSVTILPSCTENGETYEFCEDCETEFEHSTVQPSGHLWGEGRITAVASCVHTGSLMFYCSRCGASMTQEIPITSHRFTDVVTPATCKSKGYTIHMCAECHYSYTDSETEMLSHSWNEGIIVTQATCVNDGVKLFECSLCKEKNYVKIQVAGHDYQEDIIAASCTKGGYTLCTCKICAYSFTKDATSAMGHIYKTLVTEPTCLNDGFSTHVCIRCSDSYKDTEIHALGHLDREPNQLCDNCGQCLISDKSVEGLKSLYSSSEKVSLSWSDMPGVTGYYIYKLNNETDKYELCEKSQKNEAIIYNLPSNSILHFRVAAYMNVKDEEYVSHFCESTAYTAPEKVSGVKYISNDSKIKLYWDKNEAADGYLIYKYNSDARKYEAFKNVSTNTLTVSKGNEKYEYFRVRAYKAVTGKKLFGDLSDWRRAFYAPGKVNGLRVYKYGANELSLVWNRENSANEYIVYIYNAQSKKYEEYLRTKNNLLSVCGLEKGTFYYFRVRANSKTDNGIGLGVLSDVFKANTRPENGKILSANTVKSGTVTVKWAKVRGANGYTVQCSTKSDFSSGIVTKNTRSLAVTFSGLKNGKIYYIRVRPYISTLNTKIYSQGYSNIKYVKSAS